MDPTTPNGQIISQLISIPDEIAVELHLGMVRKYSLRAALSMTATEWKLFIANLRKASAEFDEQYSAYLMARQVPLEVATYIVHHIYPEIRIRYYLG